MPPAPNPVDPGPTSFLKFHVTGCAAKAGGSPISAQTIYSLTSGPTEGTFDDIVASIQNYGFRQSVFEVERLPDTAGGKAAAGAVTVLWPSSTQAHYAEMKPKDKVYCTGLRKNAAGSPALCRILRMAEGTSRNTMTECK